MDTFIKFCLCLPVLCGAFAFLSGTILAGWYIVRDSER